MQEKQEEKSENKPKPKKKNHTSSKKKKHHNATYHNQDTTRQAKETNRWIRPEIPNPYADEAAHHDYDFWVNTYVRPGLSNQGYFVSKDNQALNPYIEVCYNHEGLFTTQETYNLKQRVDAKGVFDKEKFWKYVKVDLKEKAKAEQQRVANYLQVTEIIKKQEIPFDNLRKAAKEKQERTEAQKQFLAEFMYNQFVSSGKLAFANISQPKPTKDKKGWYIDFEFALQRKDKKTFRERYPTVYPKLYLGEITNADGTLHWQKFYQKIREWIEKLAQIQQAKELERKKKHANIIKQARS